MKPNDAVAGRVIGFDAHPDSFTAAILRGPTPAAALVEKLFNKVPLGQLQSWAQKNTTNQDLFVLETSGNSFPVVRTLAAIGRQAKVLESCHLGKLKEAHANNDKISAVRIGKACLAGTAKEVWVPEARTQERRDWFHTHRKAVKRTTQVRASLRSYLSDNGVRLKKHLRLTQPETEAETQIIYDATIRFCDRFIDKRSRTHDQMVQAARSGTKNIAEGSRISGTSKESELKLTNVARASLEELLGDYKDHLRQHGHTPWDKNSKEALYVRKLGKKDNLSNEDFRGFIETRPAEVVANILISLIHQANYLLDQQLRRLEQDFLKEGGLRERMTRARLAARAKQGGWQ